MQKNIDWPLTTNIIRGGSLRHTFGMVRTNRNGTKRAHQGIDLYSEPNYRCYAISDGKVVGIRNRGAYGLQLVLEFRHTIKGESRERKLYAFYAHLSAVDTVVGQRVRKGQQLCRTGNSGNARSMRGKNQHLHFEIRTRIWTGRGLAGRISPHKVFETYPMKKAIKIKGPTQKA